MSFALVSVAENPVNFALNKFNPDATYDISTFIKIDLCLSVT